MRYKVGDRVMVQHTSFVIKNSEKIGGYHTNVGGSKDSLIFNNSMFRFCGNQAQVVKANQDSTYQYERYELDISKDTGWVWSKEMLRESERNEEEKEMQKRIQEKTEFKEELL